MTNTGASTSHRAKTRKLSEREEPFKEGNFQHRILEGCLAMKPINGLVVGELPVWAPHSLVAIGCGAAAQTPPQTGPYEKDAKTRVLRNAHNTHNTPLHGGV